MPAASRFVLRRKRRHTSPEMRTLMTELQIANLIRSIPHNIGVVLIGVGLAFVGTLIDSRLGMPSLWSGYAIATGCLLLVTGFLLRVWATFYFYENQARVISLNAATDPAHDRSISLLTQSASSGRQCLYSFRRDALAGIAVWTCDHRHTSPAGRSFHQSKRAAV